MVSQFNSFFDDPSFGGGFTVHSPSACGFILVGNEGSLELKLEGRSSLVAPDFVVGVVIFGDGLVVDVLSNGRNTDESLILVVGLVI